MVSEYDVFYVIAAKGELRIVDIVKALNKPASDYQHIFNLVSSLNKQRYVERKKTVKIIHNDRSEKLFKLISFCINNCINYNLLFKKNMLDFIQKAAKKELFTIKDIRIHPQTYNLYVEALSKYGFLLVISRKPLKCKLLRHHFFSELMLFFKKKLSFYKTHQHPFLRAIRREIKKYKKNSKINTSTIEELSSKGKVSFIHISLNLEGNPLTLPETQKLLLEDVVPENYKLTQIKEVTNYKNAIDLMILNVKKKIKLEIPIILQYHKLAMEHIKESGEFRKQNVVIKLNPSFKTADWRNIKDKINNLMKKYQEFESSKKTLEEVITFAAFFHNEFQRIHPFIDGNSRISRLLMLHILRSHNLPLFDLPIGYFDSYLDLTKRSTKRDDIALKYLVEELVLINLKKVNRAFA